MKKEKAIKMLLVDDREGNVLIPELENNGFECKVVRMTCGDYVYKNIGFERKTIDDFCESIIDGRLDNQIEVMKEVYNWVFVLISGRIGDRKSKINDNAIIGKVVSLLVRYKVFVLFADDEKQMAYMIRNIVDKIDDNQSMVNYII